MTTTKFLRGSSPAKIGTTRSVPHDRRSDGLDSARDAYRSGPRACAGTDRSESVAVWSNA